MKIIDKRNVEYTKPEDFMCRIVEISNDIEYLIKNSFTDPSHLIKIPEEKVKLIIDND